MRPSVAGCLIARLGLDSLLLRGKMRGLWGKPMGMLLIPRHKRFAIRQSVRLRTAGGATLNGLMIEVSLETCRVGACRHSGYQIDQVVTVEVDGFGDLTGLIRSVGESSFAVRFVQPIPSAELQELVWSAGDEARPILHLPAFGI